MLVLLLKTPYTLPPKNFCSWGRPIRVRSDPTDFKRAKLCRAVTPQAISEEIAITEAWQMSEEAGDSQLANSELRSEPDDWKRRDFLGPAVPDLADWKIGFRPAEYLTLSPVAADAGLRIGGADMFNLYTFTPVEGEADYLIEAKLAYQVSPDCRAQIRVDWVDASGKKFKRLRLIQLPNGGSGGVRSLHIPLRAPKAATEVKLSFLVFRQAKEDWIELHAFDWLKLLD